jgi:calcineurin-like phosphoesterase family protein
LGTFFTADQHYGHVNIIKYSNRPFSSIGEHDQTLIDNHNEVVKPKDTVIHAGDFTLYKNPRAQNYVDQLNGKHIFISGSHDYWLGKNHPIQILERSFNRQHIVICHYCMRTWARSHYNSWHLYGHSHGRLPPIGKSWDIGVDNNFFYPISFEQVSEIMSIRPDNPNKIQK